MESSAKDSSEQSSVDCNQQIHDILDGLVSRNKNKRVTDRLATIAQILLAPVVDVEMLRHICANGLPEESGRLRVFCWMVLLGILPAEKSKWQASLMLSHRHYKQFSEEFFNRRRYPNFPYGQRYSTHLPEWKELSQDFEVWEQIEKDTMRTHSELSFFSGVYEANEVPFYKTGGRKEKEKMIRGDGDHEQWLDTLDNRLYRYDVMTRILFVVSKFNQKLKYVQGMNQILAPVFYICNLDSKEPREAQSMTIFMKIASDVKELHMKEFDRTEVGLQGKLAQIEKLLMVVDYPLWARLKELEITPFFYSFRWVTLFFAQQFQLFDTITLWDHIFTHEDRYRYMDVVCLAMLQCKRKYVMENDFTVALQKLQETCDLNVREVIERATDLHRKYCNVDIEKQYALRCQTAANVDKRIGMKRTKSKTMKFLQDIFK